MKIKSYHQPVLVNDLLRNFNLDNTSVVADGTMGFAGHATAILTAYPTIHYYGFDKDTDAVRQSIEHCRAFKHVTIVNQPFSMMFKTLNTQAVRPSHILLDLGISSYQLDHSRRGFSFQRDEPLDMRMDTQQVLTAADVVNTYSADALTSLFINESNIVGAHRLVEAIVSRRQTQPYATTGDLKQTVQSSHRFRTRGRLIAELTRVFQAIRVEVNHEMLAIDSFLLELLNQQDVNHPIQVAIISFQPNEDRRVKQFIRTHSLVTVQKKPFQASYHECKSNPRQRTAKLRIFTV